MSEVIILDTHIWIWAINGNFDRFPKDWKNRFEAAGTLGVSPVSCYEIALAHQRGRLALSCSVEEWFVGALEPAGIVFFPLTETIAVRAVNLSLSEHKDPFDRLIIATALAYGAQLASVDNTFKKFAELRGVLMK